MKRIVTVQDVSCIGKCSLTVALPILSAMGLETAVLPTAVLSTHTAFDGFTFRDLTENMTGILRHWKEQQFTFDAIYTGYLGSAEQMRHVSDLIRDFRGDDTLVLIDPVMGDHGKLYPNFTDEFAKKMAVFCGQADVIVPNMTEAAALLGIPYAERHNEEEIREILRKLTDLGPKQAVLTGVSFTPDTLGVMAYDRVTDRYFCCFRPHIPRIFYGTGDAFSSVLAGALTRGESLEDALTLAVDFTVTAMKRTVDDPSAGWYGVNFEEALPLLLVKE